MIYSLIPSIQPKVWGGTRLSRLKKIPLDPSGMPLGETWEVSTHPDGPCKLLDGLKVESVFGQLPYLVKFIDTSEALSIQVHPGDEYARLHENSSGKTECWIITHADPKAIIYLGLKAGVTKESFQQALKEKRAMNEFLNSYEVRPGDFYYVPPGSIHAIGAGITLAEVQQNSGITYRVWDWNRPRELHIDKSLDVINFDEALNVPTYFKMSRGLFQAGHKIDLIEHESFKVTLYNLAPNETTLIQLQNKNRIPSVLNLDKPIKINSTFLPPMQAVLMENETRFLIENLQSRSSFLLIE